MLCAGQAGDQQGRCPAKGERRWSFNEANPACMHEPKTALARVREQQDERVRPLELNELRPDSIQAGDEAK